MRCESNSATSANKQPAVAFMSKEGSALFFCGYDKKYDK
jgi:hypothetical protein